MEDLETQESLLNLGKKLITNFNDHSDDLMCQWMANFVAEKIKDAEKISGKAKKAAQQECFEAILVMWEHQSIYPGKARPLKNFEHIIHVIESLKPNQEDPFFYKNNHSNNEEAPELIEQYIQLIKYLDTATRTSISFILKEAFLVASDQDTQDWLGLIQATGIESDIVRVIFNFVSDSDQNDEVDKDQEHREKRLKDLSDNINRLKKFEIMSKDFRLVLEDQLNKV